LTYGFEVESILILYKIREAADTKRRWAIFSPRPQVREATEGDAQSPLGPLLAEAQEEGYAFKQSDSRPSPYHGYYYRMLTAQGENAPGGAYDYVVKGKMLGGFALVAYPAQYGASGIMTFMANHDGIVYQKDLGEDTTKAAQAMSRFNPDSTWQKVIATYAKAKE